MKLLMSVKVSEDTSSHSYTRILQDNGIEPLGSLTQRQDGIDNSNDHTPACGIVPDQYLAMCTAAVA
jgi:hypothetical protein